MKLVIVESPAKAKTIEKYLGKDYVVRASIGHVRDLPKSNKDAIDIKAGFKPRYVESPDKLKVIAELKRLAEKADEVILATDPDREGEAIAWHLAQILNLKNPKRVSYNEITKKAIKEAFENPTSIDMKKVRAQEARRVLDRLVGYDLSGLIWQKVRYGLSAGRVQSPALRILMEREREIRAFKPEKYWSIFANFQKLFDKTAKFQAKCAKEPKEKQELERILKLAKSGDWFIKEMKQSEAKRSPAAPFTTSTLQQAASTRLGYSPSQTMRLAQRLYEAGLITYMRTDSPTLSKQAQAQTLGFVEKEFGKDYAQARNFKSKSKNAQEAHEAIRPSDILRKVAGANEAERKLYELIWRRTVASQMADAKIKRVKVLLNIKNENKDSSMPDFVATGAQTVFDGWLKIDPDAKAEDIELPNLQKGEPLELLDISSEEKETQPPKRYTEAGLIKELEKRGIGRPSTYASIMRTLSERGYVTKEGKTLIPTDTGDVVSSFLEKHFAKYISDTFTAEMEDELDEIALGKREYESTLKEFYDEFSKDVESKKDIEKLTTLGDAPEKFKCPKCDGPMQYKLARSGKFLSCAKYPECDGALTIDGKELGKSEPLGLDPKTGLPVYVLEGRFGAYVQLGETPVLPKLPKFPKGHKKTEEEKELVKKIKAEREKISKMPKPRRASIPKNIKPEEITLEQALHLLALPRELGKHPKTSEPVIANIGRFGPYVGHGREFRSIKKSSGLDPYTITLEEALKLLDEPKSLPKGVKLVRSLGFDPKSKKEIRLLKSKSGYFVQKGLKRLYLDEKQDPEKFTLDDALKLLSS